MIDPMRSGVFVVIVASVMDSRSGITAGMARFHRYPPVVRSTAQYSDDDFYCDIAIPNPDQLDVVYQDEWVLAFHHTRPFWTTHIVIVPKRHIASLAALASADEGVGRRMFQVVQSIAKETVERTGAAAVLTNLGEYQDSKHLHVHVHSGPRLESHAR